MKKLRVFIFFLLSVVNPKLFGWEFYVYHTTDVVPQISVEEIQPFDLYAHDIKKNFFQKRKNAVRILLRQDCGLLRGVEKTAGRE
jgi:hypothetical protein